MANIKSSIVFLTLAFVMVFLKKVSQHPADSYVTGIGALKDIYADY